MSLHLTRLCWNQDGWSRPSGVAQLAEGDAKGSKPTFVSEHGFGHEEWLFQPEHIIGGWRYGFLQPSLNAKKSLYGMELDAILYTIDPNGHRHYLGRIDGLVVLNEADAKKVLSEFKKLRWLDSMQADLADLGLSPMLLRPTVPAREIVNVKYKPSQVHMLPEALVAERNDITNKRGKNRYRFYPLEELPKILVKTHVDADRSTEAYSYSTAPIVHADRRHNRLQLKLAAMLRTKYGPDTVQIEEGGVDITFMYLDEIVFVEVKSEPDARLAIREAIGQLLEYALLAAPVSAKIPKLVVVAPGQEDDQVKRYVTRLFTQFQLPIRYVSFDEHTAECPL
jgi:hypothetical protein